MKRFSSLLIVAALVVTCIACAVFAAQTPTVNVSGATAAPGETVTLSFSLSDNPGFATYRMGITYDKNVLELKSIDAGALSAGVFQANLGNGQVAFMNGTDVSGNGVLFTATFKILAATSTTTDVGIDMNVSNLGNAAADRLTFRISDNTVVVHSCNDGHIWGGWTLTGRPTCTVAGEETRACDICGERETRPVTAPGHSWGAWAVTTKPSCTTAGEEKRTCSVCNETETRAVAATGHGWGEWVVTTKPTCTKAGEETRTCSVCNVTETREVAAAGHSWSKWEVTTKPTCTETGVQTRTCDVCKKTETRKVVAAGHSWSEWTVTKQPTHTEHGEESRTCSVCNATETRAVAPVGHTIGTEWLYDDQGHWHKCSCGEILDKEDHKLKWVITKEATETETGLQHQECEICGWRGEDVEIPATGTDGCNWILWLIIALVVVIIIVIIIIILYKRKKKEEEDGKNGPVKAA